MNRPLTMTAEQIKYMRDRFLNWTLPKDLNPDGGISFKRSESAIKYNHPMPVGTNFLDAAQAEEMVRYMIDGLPELDATRAALDASERFKNPWTIEILNQKNGHWMDFCHDAPLTLADAEERERTLKGEHPGPPDAKFRVVPWLNSDQKQFIQRQRDSSEQTIREQCAKIAESYYNPKESNDFILARIEIAAAIRSGK